MSNILYYYEEYSFQRRLKTVTTEVRIYGDVLAAQYDREKLPLDNLVFIEEDCLNV